MPNKSEQRRPAPPAADVIPEVGGAMHQGGTPAHRVGTGAEEGPRYDAGRAAPPPVHDETATQDRDPVDWSAVAAAPQFKALLAAKRRFVVPATLFFVLYYFALPILVGYAPEWMKTRVLGPVNLAYLFALSQFGMAWGVAALYLRAATRFDRLSDTIAADHQSGRRRTRRKH